MVFFLYKGKKTQFLILFAMNAPKQTSVNNQILLQAYGISLPIHADCLVITVIIEIISRQEHHRFLGKFSSE
jgi:Na+/glutamate symporter